MKSQDIGLLIKILLLRKADEQTRSFADSFKVRALADNTGIGKSEVSLSLKRSMLTGLAKRSLRDQLVDVNYNALMDFIVYGLKYVFPATPQALTRGIGTRHSAPVLAGKLLSGGEMDFVWPSATGEISGLSIPPLYKNAVFAAQKDKDMYAALALIDSIRMGNSREASVATDLLASLLKR